MTIFISDAVGEERIGFGSFASRDRAAQGRWHRLAALYRVGFADLGIDTRDLVRPEIYQTDIARAVLGVRDGDWHLAVKPFPHLRPFHGIPNVFVCDGIDDFDAARSDGSSPFHNRATVFNRADAVLCLTEGARDVLQSAGVRQAILLPPRVSLPALWAERRSRHVPDDRTACFAFFLDRDAPSDTLDHVLQDLAAARQQNGTLRLVVAAADGTLPPAAADWVADRFGRDIAAAISFGPFDLEEHGASDGVAQIDFVLPDDRGEGFSVEATQAMLCGVPLVQGRNRTAALLESAGMDVNRRRERGEDTRKDAERRFGMDAFATRVAELTRVLEKAS